MNQSRILFILPNDFLGGSEQFLKMLAEAHNTAEVYVLILKKRKTGSWEGMSQNVRIHYLTSDHLILSIFQFYFYLFKNRARLFDYVFTSHVSINGLTGFAIWLGLLKKRYFIARESTSIFKRYKGLKLFQYKLLYKFGYRGIDLLICQTQYMKDQLVQSMPWLLKRTIVEVIPNPINVDRKVELDGGDPILGTKFIVAAGRLIEEKGFDILIKAFAELEKDELNLLILGEGEKRDQLTNLIKKLKLEKRVTLKGHVTNVYPYFNKAVACVVSSRIEGFPNVLLQMMSQNNTVVSTKCAGGIADIPGIIICEPGNEVSLKSALEKAMEGDSEKNRPKIDQFLASRSVDAFIAKINSILV